VLLEALRQPVGVVHWSRSSFVIGHLETGEMTPM
jgi:hypothetical protein